MIHARRVMDRNELETITKLNEEFVAAMMGKEIKFT
jgi:hypothetical protein